MIDTPFAQHVAEGLRAEQAYLSSRFIYDAEGSRLFQEIMGLEEYYLTRAETEILTCHAATLDELFSRGGNSENRAAYELIELGAGDGTKTKLLLEAALQAQSALTYRPVDISSDILDVLTADLAQRYPQLSVAPIAASYEEAFDLLRAPSHARRVVMFLGSNIGNFSLVQATAFCRRITASLKPGDLVLIGVDLRKDPRRILAAYDDASGVTAAFNLNLLHRANRELGADFNPDAWGFYPLYNPESGEVRSYLYPRGAQRVRIEALGIDRTFQPGEVIHTEVSRKYSRAELEEMAAACGCSVVKLLSDRAGDFIDTVWEVE